ncbi:MAG: MoaD/ThiS family protein [Actinobacteria bacterium]|nr:MAG: MoaD/ThiS family protein [Actinomycetota bacterium]TML82688.1 MAG: MoaD/ThiS family protein [Actinomycetota bacterium]
MASSSIRLGSSGSPARAVCAATRSRSWTARCTSPSLRPVRSAARTAATAGRRSTRTSQPISTPKSTRRSASACTSCSRIPRDRTGCGSRITAASTGPTIEATTGSDSTETGCRRTSASRSRSTLRILTSPTSFPRCRANNISRPTAGSAFTAPPTAATRGSSRRTGSPTAPGRQCCGRASRTTTLGCTSGRRAAPCGAHRAAGASGSRRRGTCRRSFRSKLRTSDVAIVLLPGTLAAEAGGEKRFELHAATVGEALRQLPVANLLLDEAGQLRRLVNVFVDGIDVRGGRLLDEPLGEESEVRIVGAIAGG